jgi:hypothetical protein
MNKRLSKTIAAAALSVMLLGAAGCSNADEETPAPSTSETTPAADDSASDESSEAENTDTADSGVDAAKQEEILDQLVTAESGQIDAIKDQFPGVYSDIAIEYELPGTIKYTYTYAEQVETTDEMVDYFESQIDTMQEQTDSQVFPIMRSSGLEGDLGIRYIYLNADSSLIWDKTFTSSN